MSYTDLQNKTVFFAGVAEFIDSNWAKGFVKGYSSVRLFVLKI